MVSTVQPRVEIRIPNLPIGPIVDKDGNPTQNEQLFRQALIDLLSKYLSQEGIVAPNQSAANVQVILNANNTGGVTPQYTMLPGTIVYQTDVSAGLPVDKLVVAFRDTTVPYTSGDKPVLYYVNVTPL